MNKKKKQVNRLLRSTGEGSFVKRNESNFLLFFIIIISIYLQKKQPNKKKKTDATRN